MKELFAPMLALLVALNPAPLMAGIFQDRGDWMLVCEGDGDCSITGLPLPQAMPGYPRALVTIWRQNRGGAQLQIAFRLVDEWGEPEGSVDLLGLGHAVTDGIMATLQVDPSINSPHGEVLAPEWAGGVIGVIAAEQPQHLLHGFGAVGAMPLGDLGTLLERMDRVQTRVGDLPEPTIEDLPDAGIVLFPRDQVDQPIAHPEFDRVCAGAPYSHARGFALDHTTVPTLLVLLTCGRRDFLYTWYPAGDAPPRALHLPREREARYSRTRVSFDPDLGVLRLIDHPARAADCGARHTYGWVDGQCWLLLSTQEMRRCGTAMLPTYWPVTFVRDGWRAG